MQQRHEVWMKVLILTPNTTIMITGLDSIQVRLGMITAIFTLEIQFSPCWSIQWNLHMLAWIISSPKNTQYYTCFVLLVYVHMLTSNYVRTSLKIVFKTVVHLVPCIYGKSVKALRAVALPAGMAIGKASLRLWILLWSNVDIRRGYYNEFITLDIMQKV